MKSLERVLLMVTKDRYIVLSCDPDMKQGATPLGCVGFVDVASGAVCMIDGIPFKNEDLSARR